MKYTHIARYVAETPWAILPSKMADLLSVLAFRAAGHEFTPAEIQARIGGGSEPAGSSKRGAVAVIPIRGVIAHRMSGMEETSGGTSCEGIARMFRAALEDDSVGTIVFDCDSPGGTVTGVAELADEIFAAREQKRIVAVANGLMASAAYHLGSQAHEIVSIPSGIVGSIGVFAVHQDLTKALEQEGIAVTVISAGKYKTERLPFQPLSAEAKVELQGQVDAAYAIFTKAVARGRGVSASDVKTGYGEGRALTGPEAKKAGLVDRIETFDGVLGRLVGRKAPAGMRAESEEGALVAAAVTDEDAERLRRLWLL